jgi:hypothetical protein
MPDATRARGRWVYETDHGETFVMCDVCVMATADVEGEYRCPGCHQWYLMTHPDGAFVVARLYDREPPGTAYFSP